MEKVRCTRCGTPYEVEEEDLGKVFVCEGCGHDFVAKKEPTASATAPISTPVANHQKELPSRDYEHARSVPKSEAPGELTVCRYCGKMISPKTLCCPKCGAHKLYRPLLVITYVFYISLVLSIIAAVVAVAADICSDFLR